MHGLRGKGNAVTFDPEDRVRIKKIHDGAAAGDGMRILVERLWPRGVSKAAAALDAWAKEISPSPDLRKWYGHDPEKWPEFQRRYRAELADNEAALTPLLDRARQGQVTLLFSTRDAERNSANVLRALLIDKLRRGGGRCG
jgi:uncharacterized protein YeaO (DUF488 family)